VPLAPPAPAPPPPPRGRLQREHLELAMVSCVGDKSKCTSNYTIMYASIDFTCI